MAGVRRTLKRWRTLYRPGRLMFWEVALSLAGVRYAPGDPLPVHLYSDKTWLRTRWIGRMIDFIPPTMADYRGANKEVARRALSLSVSPEAAGSPPPSDVVDDGTGASEVVETGEVGGVSDVVETGEVGAADGFTVPPASDNEPHIVEKGSGWYEVTFSDGTVEKVQGRALLAELLADRGGIDG